MLSAEEEAASPDVPTLNPAARDSFDFDHSPDRKGVL